MDIKKLETLNENELEQLDTDAKEQERIMLTNLNMLDDKINVLDKEIIMKGLELKDWKKSKAQANRNLRLLSSEIETITTFLWRCRKRR